MPDPVSWKVVERGWAVRGPGEVDLGTVDEVLGDPTADIFDGLAISPGLLRRPRYVPSELVAAIYEGRVELNLTRLEFDGLPDYTGSPPGTDVLERTSDLAEGDRP